jgi:membrane protease YdiL (CAAX protease family)
MTNRADWKLGVMLVVAALALTIQEYLAPRAQVEWFVYDDRQLPLPWWTFWSVIGYVAIPLATVLALPGERVRDQHLVMRGIPAVVVALAIGLLGWRAGALVTVQLVALEFFFRGYLLGGLRRVMGDNAIAVSVVPFCMIHFNPDRSMWIVFASIGIGLALGVLAMRTRAIWPGVAAQLAALAAFDPAAARVVRGRYDSIDWARLERIAPTVAIIVAAVGAIIALLVWSRAKHNLLWRLVAKVSVDQWRAIDEDRGPGALGPSTGKPVLTIVVILVTCCVTLILQEYVGQRAQYEKWWPYDPATSGKYWSLGGFAWWTGWRVFGYLLLPMAVIALLPGERVRDYHVSTAGFLKHLKIYVALFLAILPAVIIASRTDVFRHTYPFYRLAPRSAFDTWSWELMYALQFLSLEFFFRGFLLQGLRRVVGANAIFVMIVPYCMIHYGKPMTETIGAIFAGVILGTLAMRTRSIWGGVLIHVGVAWTMDLLAIAQCPSGRACPR